MHHSLCDVTAFGWLESLEYPPISELHQRIKKVTRLCDYMELGMFCKHGNFDVFCNVVWEQGAHMLQVALFEGCCFCEQRCPCRNSTRHGAPELFLVRFYRCRVDLRDGGRGSMIQIHSCTSGPWASAVCGRKPDLDWTKVNESQTMLDRRILTDEGRKKHKWVWHDPQHRASSIERQASNMQHVGRRRSQRRSLYMCA